MSPRSARASVCLWLGLVGLCAGPSLARAQPARHQLTLAAGGALSLRHDDDRDRFGVHGALDYERRLGRVLGLSVSLETALFPYDEEMYSGSGIAMYTALAVGPRLHLLPGARVDLSVRPSLSGVLTGDLFRLGLGGEVGLAFAVSDSVALGPVLRYVHVLQPNGQLRGDADGRVLALDLALTFGRSAYARTPEAAEPETETETVAETSPEPTPPPLTPVAEPLPELEPEPEIAPPPVPEPAPEIETEPSFDAVIRFTAGSAMLRDSAVRELRRVREAMLADPSLVRVRIIGHADEVDGIGINDALSGLRARAVLDWLVAHDIEAGRLEMESVGAREPVIPGRTEEARRANRRVQILGYRRR